MSERIEGFWVDGQPLDNLAHNLRLLYDGAPGRRGANRKVARRPGTVHRSKPFDQRVQTFTMQVFGRDEYGRGDGIDRNVDRLKQLWYANGQIELTRRVLLPDGRHSTRTGFGEAVDDLVIERARGGVPYATFAVDVLMADPFWYEPDNVSEGQTGKFAVYNPGTVRHHNAIVRLHGPSSAPTLTNATTGSQVVYAGTLGAGEWVELDSDRFTAVDQTGANVIGDVTRDGVWFVELAPGRNVLDVSDGTIDLTWRPAFL